jgi:hypothetical protein
MRMKKLLHCKNYVEPKDLLCFLRVVQDKENQEDNKIVLAKKLQARTES